MIHLRLTTDTGDDTDTSVIFDGPIMPHGDEYTTIPLELTYPTQYGFRTERFLGHFPPSKTVRMSVKLTATE